MRATAGEPRPRRPPPLSGSRRCDLRRAPSPSLWQPAKGVGGDQTITNSKTGGHTACLFLAPETIRPVEGPVSRSETPKPPAGSRAAGRRLWRAVTSVYVLDQHEADLLTEACRTLDLLERLDAAVRRDGPLVDGPQGLRAHPGAVEARQQRIVFARLVSALRLPDGVEADAGRRQRRVGVRGTYGLRGVS